MIRIAVKAGFALSLLLSLTACDSAAERMQSHYEDGVALAEKGDADKAIVAFRNALRIDDAFAPAHLALAEVFMERAELGPAAAHLGRVVELQPDNADARLDLAELQIGFGELEQAAANADAALERKPGDPQGLAIRAAAMLARGELEPAVATAREALGRDPDQPLARLTLVAERIRSGDMTGALAELDAAEARLGEDAVLKIIRLAVLENMGDHQGVGVVLKRLAEMAPEDEAIRLALIRWHLQSDPPDVEAAEVLLRRSADRDPPDDEAALRLVEFLMASRGPEAARAELETRATAQGPGGALDIALATLDARFGARPAAIARAEAAIAGATDPGRVDAARILLARLLDPVADAARRQELVTAVLTRDAANVDALTLRAEDRLREDRHEEAIQDLRAALAGAPDSPAILELMAVAHERDGSRDLARERRALAAHVSDYAPEPTLRYARMLLAEGSADAAESALSDALSRSPQEPRLLALLAEARLARNDFAGAAEAAARVEAAGADGGLATRIRGLALAGSGEADRGAEKLRAAWLESGAAADLETLVRVHLAAGEPDKAAAALTEALAADAANLRARLMLADLRLSTADAAGAVATLEAGLAVEPSAPLYAALARAREASGDPAGAAAAVDAGLALDPGAAPLRFALALRKEAAGDFEGAIAEYEALYARDQSDMLVANNLASLLAEHRDDAESVARAAAVARRLRSTEVPVFLDTYGWTLHRTGAHAEAVEALTRSTAALPDEPLAHYHLGMALEATGDRALARTHLERALELVRGGRTMPAKAAEAAQGALARIGAAPASN